MDLESFPPLLNFSFTRFLIHRQTLLDMKYITSQQFGGEENFANNFAVSLVKKP